MIYDKDLLSKLLKSKIAKSKSKDEIIDELLSYLDKENQKALKNALDELFLMIVTHKDDANLQKLIANKINALELNIPNIEYEEIYSKFASEVMFENKINNVPPTFSFDETDIKALEVMRKNFYWMKNDYNEKISNDLKAITAKVFNGEITRANMAEILKEKFKGVLSANTSYFEGVSDHIISQAQNIARVNQSSKYGVKHYKVLARIDSRTSDICRSMNGRIIPASHIETQSNNIQNAKDINEKKAAAIWRNEPFLGKILPSNFGLPPYHFRCRTELVPVWIDNEDVGGVTMTNTSPLNKDEVIKHIDKTGVERVLSKENYFGGNHTKPLNERYSKKDFISALNSITQIAPYTSKENRANALTQNNCVLSFNGDEIVTMIKFENKQDAQAYFRKNVAWDKREIIKTRWWLG
ncbi:hypothetical protein [Campylobacter fetus]|uniref:hypothetical protein n=1 Tax=Campylobacter fetus TaxID=196 RepID=UPI0003E39F0A|nr:hypothetical protein [Campylobacter fetus]OCS25326.1 hypothetical protein CFVB10_08990 [Campylobacter fetus subsp. venerealis cfvB10]AIR80153.1 hypothetical protein CFV97608_0490 [Campylobacter fetus subsp. venerealis 97/608]OCS26529.1 hypothetical protein CFV33872_09045 [Campylobacter fetus subsp. venerealis CCUG 33872]OCS33673.1 hypothetical protein AWR32_09150 [Campylobacter fetus subsp. venerealis]PHJ03302.1 hypothetical protein IW21_09230 [Campylobacter fetus subsp. venerealis]